MSTTNRFGGIVELRLMEAPVNSGANERALTKFENFSAKTSSDFERFSDESSSEREKFCDENPTDVENFCDDRLDAWLAMEEESFHEPPPPSRSGAMDAALRKIAEMLSLPTSSCVLSLLDTILLNTTYRFRDSGVLTIGVRADILAKEFGVHEQTIRRLLKLIDESGYIVRGRGGEIDGITAIRLTSRALRDSTTYWVLKTKGRNIAGLVEHLDVQQLGAVASKTKTTSRNTSSPTLCAEPSHEHPCSRPFSNDLKITSGVAPRVRETVQTSEPPTEKASELSRVVVFIQALLNQVGVPQIPDLGLLKEFDFQAYNRNIKLPDLIDYIDLKVWELIDLRKESYSANTLVKILMRDLEHWKAVLTNLSSQRRAHQQALQRKNELLNPVEIEEETLEDLDQPDASPQPLKPWQERLKSQVSTSAWESVLSWLVQNEDSETTEIWAPDGFMGQWTADNFEGALTASVGPCRICWAQEGEYFDIHLKTLPEPSQDSTDVFSVEGEDRLAVDETLEPWRASLRDAVPDSAWRMFLKFLDREPSDEGVRLTCDDVFLAAWIAEHHRESLVAHFGPLELRCNDKTWPLENASETNFLLTSRVSN